VADIGKKGFTDLSSIFTQKASMYEDPNQPNGMSSSATFSQFTTQSYNDDNGHSNPIRESSPSGYGSGSSYHSKDRANVSSASKAKGPRKASATITTTTTSHVSREEKTLLDLEAEFNPSKSKPKKKTLEDEFWAELEK